MVESEKEIFKQATFTGCRSYYVSSFGRLWNSDTLAFSEPNPDSYGMIRWTLFRTNKKR